MPFFLVYEPCADCADAHCLQCVKPGRQLTLRAVHAEMPPERSINGPCETPQDLLNHMAKFFDFDPSTGVMLFKNRKSAETPHE
jgi:hypothetical protein